MRPRWIRIIVPAKTGARFSLNARVPSLASSDIDDRDADLAARGRAPPPSDAPSPPAPSASPPARRAVRSRRSTSAQRRASSITSAAGTTRLMSPIRSASAAENCSPIRRISIAWQNGICRASRTVEPPIGKRPCFTSAIAKRASSAGDADVGRLEDLGAAGDAEALDRGDDRLHDLVVPQQPLIDDGDVGDDAPVEVGLGRAAAPCIMRTSRSRSAPAQNA